MNSHQNYLLQALSAAQTRQGFCAPNPAVGAVLVREGKIIASGAHQAAGLPHAEINALKEAGKAAEGAILYVTLEPCNHQGKTPPCTEAIIKAGIVEVYYAYKDPNLDVKGKGSETLIAAGIKTHYLPLPEINEFYRSYEYWLKTKRPWITAKLALSLDGKIAAQNGSPIAITGKEAQVFTHQWRRRSDAILTTVRTVLNDDPALNVRLNNETISKAVYVIDSAADFPLNAKLLKTASSVTVFHGVSADPKKIRLLKEHNMRCIVVKNNTRGLDELQIIRHIGQEGIQDLWVEAGGSLFESLLEANLIQRIFFYLSPKILGDNARSAFQNEHDFSKNAKNIKWFSLGHDAACEILRVL